MYLSRLPSGEISLLRGDLILALIIYSILRGGKTRWIEGIHRAFHIGVLIFIAWNIFFLASARLLFSK